MSWISHNDNWINLRHIIQIWIIQRQQGWFVMGEKIGGEEIVLSPIFDSLQEARKWTHIRVGE